MKLGLGLATIIILALTQPVFGQATVTKAYFWEVIAPLGDALYCSADGERMTTDVGYSIEHIYPRSWMRQTLGCRADTCKHDSRYVYWENDLNNLWPAKQLVNTARGDRIFGQLTPLDEWRGGACGFRSRGGKVSATITAAGVVEPADRDKGIVARAVLYVHEIYGGLLPDGQKELLEQWSLDHPVTFVECQRQKLIADIQTLTNPYIVCPED